MASLSNQYDGDHRGYGHCATYYSKSKQRSPQAVQAVIARLIQRHNIPLNSIIDFGTGDGYWINAITALGQARGRVIAVDVSEGMLAEAQKRVKAQNVEFVRGDARTLQGLDIEGVETLFVAMVAHLLPFPDGVAELINIARQKSVRHVVLLEEVSHLYSVLTGNPGFAGSLPQEIGAVFGSYLDIRARTGEQPLGSSRTAPFPTPALPLAVWRRMGVEAESYFFDVPDISWNWSYSAANLVEDIGRRAFSVCFCHSLESAKSIAEELESMVGSDANYTVTRSIPFWYQLHIFKTS